MWLRTIPKPLRNFCLSSTHMCSLTGVQNRVGGGSWPHLDNIEKNASFLVAYRTWSTPWHHQPGWYAALSTTAILPYYQLLEG